MEWNGWMDWRISGHGTGGPTCGSGHDHDDDDDRMMEHQARTHALTYASRSVHAHSLTTLDLGQSRTTEWNDSRGAWETVNGIIVEQPTTQRESLGHRRVTVHAYGRKECTRESAEQHVPRNGTSARTRLCRMNHGNHPMACSATSVAGRRSNESTNRRGNHILETRNSTQHNTLPGDLFLSLLRPLLLTD